MRRLHKHMEDGYREVFTDGEGYDCPPERKCWMDVEDELAEVLLANFKPVSKAENTP